MQVNMTNIYRPGVSLGGNLPSLVPNNLTSTSKDLFGSKTINIESKEEHIIRTKLKYGLVHGNGIRKKKPRKKRKKTYGKHK